MVGSPHNAPDEGVGDDWQKVKSICCFEWLIILKEYCNRGKTYLEISPYVCLISSMQKFSRGETT